MKPKRYVAFYIAFAFAAVMIIARLANLQIANGSYYREKSDLRTDVPLFQTGQAITSIF